MAEEIYSNQTLAEMLQEDISEEFPKLNLSPSEINLSTKESHNASITIGRDRPAGMNSGYGRLPKNKGGDKSTTIAITVGHYSADSGKDGYLSDKIVGRNTQLDASQIYISQKTDVDTNFQIERAGTLAPATGKAAIAFKSDNLRIIGRESVKIVAMCGEEHSQGEKDIKVNPMYGIQLITGITKDSKDIQSIVKSENLKECLMNILELIDGCYIQLNNYITLQQEFNAALADHSHEGYFNSTHAGSVIVQPDYNLNGEKEKLFNQVKEKVLKGIEANRKNRFIKIKTTYLSKSSNSKNYIGSLYNKTN